MDYVTVDKKVYRADGKDYRLAEGKPCEELDLHPDRTFYILGIAPNAARLSVRFFLRDTFGRIMKNINEHNERMEIIRPANDNYVTLPM